MLGLLIALCLILLILGLILSVVKCVASPRPTPVAGNVLALVALAFITLVFLGLMFDKSRPGNEFGPLAEILFLYPTGLLFWLGSLILLHHDRKRGGRWGYVRTGVVGADTVLYLIPLLQIIWELFFQG